MYDNTCKFLVENFPTDFATWLLGKPIALTKLEPSELSADPIRADSVILLGSSEVIVHLEFQTKTDDTMPYRMANYYLRLYGKYPTKDIHQTVIYLRPTKSILAYQNNFKTNKLNHEFNVIRLWEQPTETFQQYQGLLPLAVLTKTDNPSETLREVAKLIDNIEDGVIQRLLGSEIMEESVFYQGILLKGLTKGKAEGLAKGKVEASNQIALNMLRSNMAVDLVAQLTGLTLKQVQKLQKTSTKKGQKPKANL
jgi:predicted transposase YdaD